MGFFDWMQGKQELPRTGSDPADTVLLNGRVLTCDGESKKVEAFAVRDGRFVFVGSDSGIADYVGPDTEVIDAGNRVVTPGFIDSHCHILWVGALEPLLSQEHYNCDDFEQMAAAIREHAESNPDLPFIFVMGWNHDKVPGGVPTAAQLDEVLPDRPVILWSDSAHCGWVNTMALDLMQERNPEAFEQLLPVRDEDGKPTGEFLTFWFVEPFFFFTEEEIGGDLKERMLEGMRNAIDMALSFGVTGYDDVMIHRSFMPLVFEFLKRGGFERSRCRGTFYINHHMPGEMAELEKFLTYWKGLADDADEHFVMGTSVKMGTDGVSPNHTAYMLEPYCDKPDSCGEPSWDQDDYVKVVRLAHSLGLQIATHATGDAAIRAAVDGYEEVAEDGRLSIPHRVDHCSNPTPADIDRMASLGVSAAMQPPTSGPARRERRPWVRTG